MVIECLRKEIRTVIMAYSSIVPIPCTEILYRVNILREHYVVQYSDMNLLACDVISTVMSGAPA